MAEPDLFEEMLATYPAEKRELARKVYQRFAEGDSTQFFTQLLLVLDVYARYVERIPKAAVQANQDSFAILQDTREEIAMIAGRLSPVTPASPTTRKKPTNYSN